MDDMNLIETPVSSETVYDGGFLTLEKMTVTLPSGKPAGRLIVRHNGASAVVPIDDKGNVYFVRQYRAPLQEVMLEIPAGKHDKKGDDGLATAMRELREETGLTAKNWTHLTELVTTPGFSDEIISLYMATDLAEGEDAPDEDEFLNVVKIPLDESLLMVQNGEIRDGKTICGLLLAARLYECEKKARNGCQTAN